jgi:hypothetical protein
MPIALTSFANVKALRTPVATPQRLLEVSRVAVVDLEIESETFVKEDLVFVVLQEGEDKPVEDGGQPLNVGHVLDSVVDVFLATAKSTIGWGVDTADSSGTADGENVQVTAKVALANGTIERIGFRVSILAF